MCSVSGFPEGFPPVLSRGGPWLCPRHAAMLQLQENPGRSQAHLSGVIFEGLLLSRIGIPILVLSPRRLNMLHL